MKQVVIFGVMFLLLLLGGCQKQGEVPASTEREKEEAVQIGLSCDTFVLERWIRDRDVFVSTARAMGAEVNVQNANGDKEKQVSQIEYLMEKGMDVIVIVAIDTSDPGLLEAVQKAQREGIKVIAYDRLIQNAGVDLYLSVDSEKVGELMAEAVLEKIPGDGKIAAILGSPTDANVALLEDGITKVLNEHGQELVYLNYADGWKAEYGYEYTEECLEEQGRIDALICGNDGLASFAFQSLAEHRLADHVVLVGQDADIEACQRIVEGQQYMTVYKDLQTLAKQTAQCAVAMGRGEQIDARETVWDGSQNVPAFCLEPVAVTEENMEEEIIDSQFHFRDEVYLHAESE